MRWFSDTSEDEHITDEFLRHRIDDVMRFERSSRRNCGKRASGWPSISEFLNPGDRLRGAQGREARDVPHLGGRGGCRVCRRDEAPRSRCERPPVFRVRPDEIVHHGVGMT